MLLLGEYPVFLQKAPVGIIATDICNAKEAYNGLVEDEMLCAGYLQGNIDACYVSFVHYSH